MPGIEFFLKGIVIGLAIAAPVGPIGILCIRRTLAYGRPSGFVSGLGAATADFIYGTIAAFGLTFISDFLLRENAWLRLIGGIFLLYLGIKTFQEKLGDEATVESSENDISLLADYSSTFVLTLTNPATVFSFLAIFAAFGVASAKTNYSLATLLAIGVLIGSAIWWLCLSGITGLLKDRLKAGGLNAVNKISGGVIAAFGVIALVSLL
ncbi:MAG: LysE family translocator [Candidatus Andersenbacteria bacterium]|nr:LysE family translocator [Candidatus Andersenbacteria bacterium]